MESDRPGTIVHLVDNLALFLHPDEAYARKIPNVVLVKCI
jgi:hypothetical protein